MTPPRRIRLERLDLDLRGVAPDVARAAIDALAPALAAALRERLPGPRAPTGPIDAGRVAAPPAPTPHGLAATIAAGVARGLRGTP